MSSAAGVAQTTNKKNLTNDQRNAVIAELLGGNRNGKIAKGDFSRVAEKFGCYWKTISRLWKKYDTQKSNGVLSPDMRNGHKRSGRKGIDLQTLRDKLKRVPIKTRTTHRGLAAALNIPKSTLQDNLKDLGLKASSRKEGSYSRGKDKKHGSRKEITEAKLAVKGVDRDDDHDHEDGENFHEKLEDENGLDGKDQAS